jgi:hypothetical protein
MTLKAFFLLTVSRKLVNFRRPGLARAAVTHWATATYDITLVRVTLQIIKLVGRDLTRPRATRCPFHGRAPRLRPKRICPRSGLSIAWTNQAVTETNRGGWLDNEFIHRIKIAKGPNSAITIFIFNEFYFAKPIIFFLTMTPNLLEFRPPGLAGVTATRWATVICPAFPFDYSPNL